MDNLTHTLTAVLLSRAGLNRYSSRATLILIAASNIPDIDVVTSVGGPLNYLTYHRHSTHALAFAPFVAAACAGLLTAAARVRPQARLWSGIRFLPAFSLSLIGVLTHILLDLLNNYGVRIGLPFIAQWTAFDLFMVIEPWLTLVMLLCLAAPALASLVGGEIGSVAAPVQQSKYVTVPDRPVRNSAARNWAVAGFVFFAAWIGLRWTNHTRALEVLHSRSYHGQTPARIAAWPTPWNPFHWRGYVETDTMWTLPTVQLLHPFDPESGPVYLKPESHDRLQAASSLPQAKQYLQFAQFPVWRTLPSSDPDSPIVVTANDVRFGLPEDEKFQLIVKFGADGRPVSAVFSFGNPVRGMGLIRPQQTTRSYPPR